MKAPRRGVSDGRTAREAELGPWTSKVEEPVKRT